MSAAVAFPGFIQHKRQEEQGNRGNSGLFIALCAKICRESRVKYVVAYQETDIQIVIQVPAMYSPIIITGDSDLIAFGSRYTSTIIVKSWSLPYEKYRTYVLSWCFIANRAENRAITRLSICCATDLVEKNLARSFREKST